MTKIVPRDFPNSILYSIQTWGAELRHSGVSDPRDAQIWE
jgi:hypothetical protein